MILLKEYNICQAVFILQVWHWHVPTSKSQQGKSQRNLSQPAVANSQGVTQPRKTLAPISATSLGKMSHELWGSSHVHGRSLEALAKVKAATPQLLGILHNLPSNVTTVSACMAAVATSTAPSSAGCSHLTGLLAAATVGGSIELITFSCGALLPLAAQVSISLGEAKLL